MKNTEMEIDSREFDLLVKAALEVQPVEAAVVTTSAEAQDYWPVLERGSAEGSKPWPRSGPRTRLSGGRIFSRQAVGGFVMKHANIFIRFLSDAYRRVAAGREPSQGDLAAAVNQAADNSLEFVKSVVPVDSGQLRDSLKVKKA